MKIIMPVRRFSYQVLANKRTVLSLLALMVMNAVPAHAMLQSSTLVTGAKVLKAPQSKVQRDLGKLALAGKLLGGSAPSVQSRQFFSKAVKLGLKMQLKSKNYIARVKLNEEGPEYDEIYQNLNELGFLRESNLAQEIIKNPKFEWSKLQKRVDSSTAFKKYVASFINPTFPRSFK